MKILLDTSSFHHNIHSNYEGLYRIEKLEANTKIEKYIKGEDFLELVHDELYIHNIRKACNNNSYLAEVELSPLSYTAACNAVGLAIQASEQNDFAIVRPPGHHASYNKV